MKRWLIPFILMLGVGLPGRVFADAIVVTKAMTASTIVEIFIEDSSITAGDQKIHLNFSGGGPTPQQLHQPSLSTTHA